MAITNGYCTLAEYKLYSKITSTDTNDDSVLEDIIEGVSRAIDTFTARTFYARTETRYYDTPEGQDLQLDDDLLTVTTLTNGDGTVLTSQYYKLYPLNFPQKYMIRLTNTYGWRIDPIAFQHGAISVAGTWGYSSTTPDDIKQICLYETQAEYHRRFGENMSTVATVTASGIVITPQGFAASTLQKLRPYRQIT